MFCWKKKDLGIIPNHAMMMIPLNSILNPSAWNDPTWASYMTALKINPSRDRLHRKKWEVTQTMYGLDKLGFVNEKNVALDVGAGTEEIIFHMANRVKKIIATDLYDFEDRGLFPAQIKHATINEPWKFAKIAVQNLAGFCINKINTFSI